MLITLAKNVNSSITFWESEIGSMASKGAADEDAAVGEAAVCSNANLEFKGLEGC